MMFADVTWSMVVYIHILPDEESIQQHLLHNFMLGSTQVHVPVKTPKCQLQNYTKCSQSRNRALKGDFESAFN